MTDNVDYIIVGAGAAGCVLAYRLSADPGVQVLLLEAGGSDRHPLIHMPKGISKVMADPSYIWPYAIQPEPGSNNAQEIWARGRTLGGSSAINGMVYCRGQASDYEALAATTSDDWNWRHIAAAYEALEGHELGAAPSRGGSGPLRITLPERGAPLMEAALQAGAALGVPVKEDMNDPSDEARISYAPRTIHAGRRQSAATAFLDPARSRPNLRIVTGVRADSLEFDGRRATGVRAFTAGSAVTYRARREVLLCAGAMASPAILQRSGIGPAGLLRGLGVPLLVDSPLVGGNLREHRGVVMQWRTREAVSQNRDFRGLRLLANTARYYLRHDGPMAAGAYDGGAWVKTRPGLDRPDAQILIAPFSFDYTSPTFAVERQGGMNLCVYMLRPESTGTVQIRSRDSAELPVIQANYGSAAVDVERMIGVMRYARRLVAQAPLGDMVLEETRPGGRHQTDEELLQAYLQCGYGSYHASGTCRMGSDAAAVVDPRLRVRGVEALRVIDTSIFPFMLAGNTNAPAMATAWRAADLILEDR